MRPRNSSKSASVLLAQCGLIDLDVGASLRSLRLARTLSEGGFKVTLLGLQPSSNGLAGYDRQYVNGVEIWRIGIESAKARLLTEYSISLAREFSRTMQLIDEALIYGKIVRRSGADIVTLISGHPLFQIATLLSLPKDSKLLIDFQDVVSQGAAVLRNWSLNHPMVRALKMLELYEARRAKGVLTVGWTTGAALRTELRAKAVLVYPNFSSTQELERLEEEASLLHNNITHHLEESKKTKFVYLGRLDPGSRGLEHLLELMMNLPPTFAKKMLFLFIGNGGLHDLIKNSSERMHCEVILTGQVPRSLAFAMLRRCDVALLPYPPDALSLSEMRGALPSKVFEYAYFGLPVVMPNLPDAKLVAGELATVYDDWDGLQRILVSFVSADLRAPKDLSSTRKRLSEEFQNESFSYGLVNFYKSILTSASQS